MSHLFIFLPALVWPLASVPPPRPAAGATRRGSDLCGGGWLCSIVECVLLVLLLVVVVVLVLLVGWVGVRVRDGCCDAQGLVAAAAGAALGARRTLPVPASARRASFQHSGDGGAR